MIFFVSWWLPNKSMTIRKKKDNMYLFVSWCWLSAARISVCVQFQWQSQLNMVHVATLRLTNVISHFDIWFLMITHQFKFFSSNHMIRSEPWLSPTNTNLGEVKKFSFNLSLSILKGHQHYHRVTKTNCILHYYACLVHLHLNMVLYPLTNNCLLHTSGVNNTPDCGPDCPAWRKWMSFQFGFHSGCLYPPSLSPCW